MERSKAFAAFDALAARGISGEANYQWRIARRPGGNVRPYDLSWGQEPIPEPGEAEVLLHTHYLGLAPVRALLYAGHRAHRRRDVAAGRCNPWTRRGILHGALPFLFVKTGSKQIATLHGKMVVSRSKLPEPLDFVI